MRLLFTLYWYIVTFTLFRFAYVIEFITVRKLLLLIRFTPYSRLCKVTESYVTSDCENVLFSIVFKQQIHPSNALKIKLLLSETRLIQIAKDLSEIDFFNIENRVTLIIILFLICLNYFSIKFNVFKLILLIFIQTTLK